MDNTLEIIDYVEIRNLNDLEDILNVIKKALELGELKQYWLEGNKFASVEKVDLLGVDGTYPDYIEMYFQTKTKNYKLTVETYHGTGGEWQVLG